MAVSFSLAATTPPGGRAGGQLIIPPPVNRERQNSPSNSNIAAINAAAATMRMRNGRNGPLRSAVTTTDDPDEEPVLTAMAALFESLHEVHLEGGSDPWKPSIKTADGFRACKQFLYALDHQRCCLKKTVIRVSDKDRERLCIHHGYTFYQSAAADALKIRPQSREYRNQFTKNYRALFPDQKRHYRVDVLEASQEGYTMIYVNGERFDFHGSVVESGVNFKLAWITAMDKLQQLQRENLSTYLYWRSELVPILVDLDSKWADFEQEYILELIQIERKARRYVMDVIYLENQLVYLDSSVATLVAKGDASETAHLHIWQQWQSCRRDYVRKIFRLNAIANYRRRGRGDLDLSVLETAENIIETSESHPGHVYEAVSSIAASCVTSFNDFRKHINELAQTPERIDPHLCNNVTLVNHLVRLEETWELAQKYLMDTQRLRNIIHIVDFILSIVRTQKAVIAILSSAGEASSGSSSSSSSSATTSSSGAGLEPKTGGRTTVAAAAMLLDSEKKRSLGDIFSGSSTSSSFTSASAFSSCGSSRDTGIERHQHRLHEEDEGDQEEEEEECDVALGVTGGGIHHVNTFLFQKKENALDIASAAPSGSTSRSETLSCTTRGSIMRQRTSSSTSADRRETLEEKLIACDVEAFLALPRFVCLYYLLDPIHRSHILRQFLPHYFVECQGFSDTCVEPVEEVCAKNSQQHVSLFPPPVRKSSGASAALHDAGGVAGADAAAVGCSTSGGGSASRRDCTRNAEELSKSGALSDAAALGGESAAAAAHAEGVSGSNGRTNNGTFRCSDYSAEEDAEEDQEPGMDIQQQLHQGGAEAEGEVKEEECRLLSISASDATTRPPSRLSSHFDSAVSISGTAVSASAPRLSASYSSSSSSSSSSSPASSIPSCSSAAAAAAAASAAAAAACSTNGHNFCDVASCTQSTCTRSKLLASQGEAESEGSTVCSSSLRDSTDSAIASSSSSSGAAVGYYCSASSSATFANAAAAAVAASAADLGAEPSTALSHIDAGPAGVAAAASSSTFSADAISGYLHQQQHHHHHHQRHKGVRGGYACSSGATDENNCYHCAGMTTSAAAAAVASNERTCNKEWFSQQNSRFVISKVPAGLRKMVKAWLRIQSWLKAEGLQDSKEAWLCIIARLADSEDFKLLLQKWAETKLAGFRHHLEALFQSVEEISMALQRSSPQDWNEFLQAIIQGIQRDSPSRRNLL